MTTVIDEHDQHWDEWMAMTNREQRKQALYAALKAFEAALSEQDCWVPDVMARVATLQEAIAEYGDAIEAHLAGVPNTVQ